MSKQFRDLIRHLYNVCPYKYLTMMMMKEGNLFTILTLSFKLFNSRGNEPFFNCTREFVKNTTHANVEALYLNNWKTGSKNKD